MSVQVSVKNKAHIDVEGCDEVITFDSNEVESTYLNIEVKKSASCIWAVRGKNLTYCTDVTNMSAKAVADAKFNDTLDLGLQYVDGSFTIDGVTAVPQIAGQQLSYTIPQINMNQTVKICFQVKVL